MFGLDNKKIIIISGPTASGKSGIAIDLAKILKSEIISADSRQVYKFMNIGTSKPNKSELNRVKHHMIDLVNPDQNFSIAQFQNVSLNIIDNLYKKNMIPIICGGTGFYINAILYKNNFLAAHDKNFRLKINCLTNIELYDKLREIDLESSELINVNNRVKLIRALEFFYTTGKKISEHNKLQKRKKMCFDAFFFVICPERELLYKEINSRVDKMIENGLVRETEFLLSEFKSSYLKKTIGYKEIIDYINNDINLDTAIKLIKKNTRHYAKRQITWFRNQINVKNKFYISDIKEIFDIVRDFR
ncbi:MAG: tRNA (adenosine(37)-N6)-dimethylallyltransferase MiaA [Clostridiales bacterium]|nr:tRNA (adenosine(37)-N6)-dimethylallyltransferase MiaA [Clostridiales bacterium]